MKAIIKYLSIIILVLTFTGCQTANGNLAYHALEVESNAEGTELFKSQNETSIEFFPESQEGIDLNSKEGLFAPITIFEIRF